MTLVQTHAEEDNTLNCGFALFPCTHPCITIFRPFLVAYVYLMEIATVILWWDQCTSIVCDKSGYPLLWSVLYHIIHRECTSKEGDTGDRVLLLDGSFLGERLKTGPPSQQYSGYTASIYVVPLHGT